VKLICAKSWGLKRKEVFTQRGHDSNRLQYFCSETQPTYIWCLLLNCHCHSNRIYSEGSKMCTPSLVKFLVYHNFQLLQYIEYIIAQYKCVFDCTYLFRSESSAPWTIPPSSSTMGQPHRMMYTTLSQVCQTSEYKCHRQCQPKAAFGPT